MKTFEKATKHLVEFSKVFPKEYKKLQENAIEDYKEVAEELGKTVGVTVGESVKKSLSSGAATMVQAIVGGAGPIGYILEKTLNLSGATEALISNFKGRKNRSTSLVSEGGINSGDSSKNKKESRDNFESYPTITKLRAYLDYKAKTNSKYEKFQKEVLNRGKEQAKFEKDQRKEQANLKRIFQNMQKGIDKQALIDTAIAAGVILGVGALVGLGVWIKNLMSGTKNTTAENGKTGTISKDFATGDYSGSLQVTSTYGKRGDVKDSQGKVIRKAGNHYGVDIADTAHPKEGGAPVKSLTPGKAYARMQTTSGFQPYKQGSLFNKEVLVGYGKFVDVVCFPSTAERLGFAGRTVTIRYAHLRDFAFTGQGVTVRRGQILGTMGNSGTSSGAHVHIEVLVDGEKVPANSIGKQMAFNSQNDTWERQYTVDPNSLKFLDLENRPTSAAGAYISLSSDRFKTDQRITSETKTDTPNNPWTSASPTVKGLVPGVSTGGAANISFVGKNDSLMEANNITARTSESREVQQSGYVGTLPTLGNTIQSSTEEPKFQLSFDIENSATKALKQADKSIDFIKV
jgi:murein DD-endopeptidase MepM/ murein hydrolase activator NlpD